MKYEVEQLLQQALSPTVEPDIRLNRKILQKAKENEHMTKRRNRFPAGVAAAVCTLLIASLGVFAGWKYLAPQTVAEEVFADRLLSEAFETDGAIQINETQEYGEYRVTLLGIVSGEGLSEYTEWDEEGKIADDKTYVVTAIENADGTPRPDVSDTSYGQDTFYVSPYIKGMSMTEYNAHTLGGGYSEDVVDGIQYRIMECDNIEIFAHKGLYLGVSDGTFFNAEAYCMDEATGEITRNEAYGGVNALFELPIPAFKGNEMAVEAYLAEKSAEQQEAAEVPDEAVDEVIKVSEMVRDWTLADFMEKAACVVEQELTPDASGYISYRYQFSEGAGSEAKTLMSMLFEEGQPGLSEIMTIYEENPTYIETFELLENGNVVLRVFAY